MHIQNQKAYKQKSIIIIMVNKTILREISKQKFRSFNYERKNSEEQNFWKNREVVVIWQK